MVSLSLLTTHGSTFSKFNEDVGSLHMVKRTCKVEVNAGRSFLSFSLSLTILVFPSLSFLFLFFLFYEAEQEPLGL